MGATHSIFLRIGRLIRQIRGFKWLQVSSSMVRMVFKVVMPATVAPTVGSVGGQLGAKRGGIKTINH